MSKTSLSFSINNGVSNGSDMHPSMACSNMSESQTTSAHPDASCGVF